MDDLTQQKQEIEVLASIYGKDWKVDNEEEGLYHVNIESSDIQLILLLEFPPDYPSQSPPIFELMTSSLCTADKEDLENVLRNIYVEKEGETIVYEWVEGIREWIHQKFPGDETESCPVKHTVNDGNFAIDEQVDRLCSEMQENVEIIENSTTTDIQEESTWTKPNPVQPSHLHIIHGDTITFKKSSFQGHAAEISDPKDAQVFLKELMENKKIAHATHNIQAFRIYKGRNNSFDEHFEDDGEKQAGHRLLHLMQMMDVRNVIVMVSRWYGGVHLGPDRFRLINNAAKEVLEKGNFVPPPEVKKRK